MKSSPSVPGSSTASPFAIKVSLVAQGDAVEDPGALGDDFMLQNYYPEKDVVEIQKLFGSGFTESLVELSPGQWHGPVLSGYGVHLVYISSVSEPPAQVLADVRERVVQDWEMERGEELNDKFYVSLRDQYTVVIESADEKDTVAVVQEQAQ